ncbi:MAG: aminoacyl-tRNA deacylase [Gammaproteobacteria bacterium]|nr:MAG: aminoacyl-tRNA deacylase [Gammaproteobacteria bacterium]
MTIAATQQRYLIQRNAEYDLMLHPHTASSHETAEAAHISEDHIAKAVVVKDASDYAIVVIPASNRLRMNTLRRELNRDLHLATEDEIAGLFDDCEPGAVPPLGPAYGIETLLDESFTSLANVYFEAGDHEQLVHLRGEDFQALLSGARRGYYSHDS